VRAPAEQSAGSPPTVAYAYFPTAPEYAYATARHFDRFAPADPIDTVAFIDGLGRTTQTKHDVDQLAADPETPSVDQMLVAGAVEYDALGREVKQWWPTVEPLGTIGAYKFTADEYPPTTLAYTLTDRISEVAVPSGEGNDDPHVTRTTYGFGGGTDGLPSGVFVATTSDPTRSDDPATGKGQVLWSSVRDEVLAVDDVPSGAPTLRTRYSYDRLGQLVRVVDSAGNATSHSYDGLGRRLSTRTPDAGLREQVWDPAGNLVAEVTPNQRTAGTRIAYDYDVDRLTKIDYPTGTPDVTYRYGGQGADGNGAGRVVALEDGAREQSLAYDALGNVAVETTTMKAQNLNADTRAKLTYRTAFEHDSFGRLAELTYPDGEVLRHEYDSGGMLSGLQGTKDCTELGRLTAAVAASATTITMTEVASSAPAVPFTIRIGREQLRVTERTATADPAVFTYTVERGVNGTLEVPTAAAHSAGAKATSTWRWTATTATSTGRSTTSSCRGGCATPATGSAASGPSTTSGAWRP
jgi:YD repeat-containing protein